MSTGNRKRVPGVREDHTPGPLIYGWAGNPSNRYVDVCDERGHILARFFPTAAGKPQPAEGNARLYTASPEVLQALQNLYAAVLMDDLIPSSVGFMKDAEAAIAKAKGGAA